MRISDTQWYFAVVLLTALLCAGCATAPVPVVVSGNGKCHPAQDLPAHKTIKPVPEVDTFMEDLYGLFALERSDHAKDISDYNSLWATCVGGAAVGEAAVPGH